MPIDQRPVRRKHSQDFKDEVVAEALAPGVSVAAVASSRGINANLLRRWIAQRRPGMGAAEGGRSVEGFVPISIADAPTPAEPIHIEIERAGVRVVLRWPAAQAQACAIWLGRWLA